MITDAWRPQGAAHYFEMYANSRQYGMHVCAQIHMHTLTDFHKYLRVSTLTDFVSLSKMTPLFSFSSLSLKLELILEDFSAWSSHMSRVILGVDV